MANQQQTEVGIRGSLWQMFVNGRMTDMDVRVSTGQRTKTFKCHKVIVACLSNVFQNLIVESEANGYCCVNISALDPDLFSLVLNYAYTDTINFKSMNEALAIRSMSNKYDIIPLRVICDDFILRMLDVDSVWVILDEPQRTNRLSYKLLAFLSKYTAACLQSPRFLSCHQASLLTLLKMPRLYMTSELQLVQAVIKWAVHRNRNLKLSPSVAKDLLGPCLQHLRFLALSPLDFSSTVANSGLLPSEECLSILVNLNSPGQMALPASICRKTGPRDGTVQSDLPVGVIETPPNCEGRKSEDKGFFEEEPDEHVKSDEEGDHFKGQSDVNNKLKMLAAGDSPSASCVQVGGGKLAEKSTMPMDQLLVLKQRRVSPPGGTASATYTNMGRTADAFLQPNWRMAANNGNLDTPEMFKLIRPEHPGGPNGNMALSVKPAMLRPQPALSERSASMEFECPRSSSPPSQIQCIRGLQPNTEMFSENLTSPLETQIEFKVNRKVKLVGVTIMKQVNLESNQSHYLEDMIIHIVTEHTKKLLRKVHFKNFVEYGPGPVTFEVSKPCTIEQDKEYILKLFIRSSGQYVSQKRHMACYVEEMAATVNFTSYDSSLGKGLFHSLIFEAA